MKIEVRFTLNVEPKYLKALRELTTSENNLNAATFIRGEAEDLIMGYMEDNGVVVTVIKRDGIPIDPPPDPERNPYSDETYWSSQTGFLLHIWKWDRGEIPSSWCGRELIGTVSNTAGLKVCKICTRNLKIARSARGG